MRNSVQITGLGHGGEGLCRIIGAVCLVPDALPGDVVRLRNIEKRRGVLRAVIDEIVEPSGDRIAVECPVFDRCGGCSWLNFAYPAQGEWKRRIVAECFQRIAGIEITPQWREDPALRVGYRTRARFHEGPGGYGFYARNSHDVVPITTCPLGHPRLNEALAALPAGENEVTITVNPEGDDTLIAGENRDSGSRFDLDGVPILAQSFSQSSLLLNRMLRHEVDAALGEPDSLLDLYCGSGNFSLAWTDRAKVTGVDSNGPAIMAALRASGADYRVGNEAAMREVIVERAWDTILLDPPRAGARKITRALSVTKSKRIVYVSCDPATLARDAKVLVGAGWKLTNACVVDMFPNTPHVETVALFTR